MPRTRAPLARRIRANAGSLALFGVWSAAALTILALRGAVTHGPTQAVARIRQHPLLPCGDGRLASIEVSPGKRVVAGQVLAVVEIPGLAQQVTAADASVRALEAELARDGAELDRKLARDADDAQARYLAASVQLHAARAALAGAEDELARNGADGVAAAGVVQALRRTADAARAEIAAREEEVARLEAAWHAARGRAGGRAADAAVAGLDAARAQRDALAAQLDACTVRAPTDGIVSVPVPEARSGVPTTEAPTLVAGQWVARGQPMLAVTEARSAESVAYMDAARARTLRAGDTATLVDTDGETTAATVAAVGAAVEPVPLRHLTDPSVPQWGVPVTFVVAEATLTPGDAFAVDMDADAPSSARWTSSAGVGIVPGTP